MNKITFQGIRYDTKKSTLIGKAAADLPKKNLHYWSESLYVTPRSERYFVSGEGGPLSHWAHPTGDGCAEPGKGIRPVSWSDARQWAIENLSPQLVEKHFHK